MVLQLGDITFSVSEHFVRIHQAKIVIGQQIAIWALMQNVNKVWLKVQYLVICYPNKDVC